LVQIAISKSSDLSSTKRLDAEFFLPEGILATKMVLQLPKVDVLKKNCTRITQGPNPKFKSSGTPCLNGKNIYLGTASAAEPNFVSNEEFEKYKSFKLKPNDIVITLKHATKIGRLWIIDNDERKMFSRNVGLIRLSKKSTINPPTLLFYLWSNQSQKILDRIATGGTSGQITLTISQLKTIPIPVFSKNFQNFLSKSLREYQSLTQLIQDTYDKAEGLLLTELGIKEWNPRSITTFSESISSVINKKRMDAEHFQPKFHEMFEKLKNVSLIPLWKLSKIKKGIEVGSDAYTNKGYPFWRVSNLTKYGFDESSLNFISNEKYLSLKNDFEPKKGELLLSKDATPGLCYYLDRPIKGLISGGILRLIPKRTILPYYLEIVINSLVVQLQIEQDAGGSIIKHWKPSLIANTLIPRLKPKIEEKINQLVKESHQAREQSIQLLEDTINRVESIINEPTSNELSKGR